MKLLHILPMVLGTAVILGGQAYAQSRGEESQEKSVALSSIPKPAVDAAKKALGADPTEAKLISGTRPQQYELEARNSAGKEASVHVQANGKIVKRETENEENESKERGERSEK